MIVINVETLDLALKHLDKYPSKTCFGICKKFNLRYIIGATVHNYHRVKKCPDKEFYAQAKAMFENAEKIIGI